MFTVLDASPSMGNSRQKAASERACDQCKLRKVRCDMSKPCVTCSKKGFNCTYDKPRKKRGPAGKRITEIRRLQESVSVSDPASSPQDGSTKDSSPISPQYPQFPPSPGYREPLSFNQTLSNSSDASILPDVNFRLMNDAYSVTPPSAHSLPGQEPEEFRSHTESSTSYPDPERNEAWTAQSNPYVPATVTSAGLNGFTSPASTEFLFPSLPVDSPSSALDPFAGLVHQDVVGENPDIWPSTISEATLLPWIDVYFKRLHPTVPILNRTRLYQDMLLCKHRVDRQYGSMLLALCAWAMTQPVQIQERASVPSRAVQARMMMEEAVKMRASADFGEDPTVEAIMTSFFLFACLFGNSQHKAAWHRLREAVDMAYSLGLHRQDCYHGLTTEQREQWLRTYLVLSVTERAYALQQRHSIGFRGRPGLNARFMQTFDSTVAAEHISGLIYQDQADAIGMTGLLYLMETFDAIDESIIDCWNGHCQLSDGQCTSFDRRRALQMFRAQRNARDSCISGTMSFAPSATPIPLSQLPESQQADIRVTQCWLLNRLWNLCLGHGLLRETSDHSELQYNYPFQVGYMILEEVKPLSLEAMETHGIGLVEKFYDITIGIITAIQTCPNPELIKMDAPIAIVDPGGDQIPGMQMASSASGISPTLRNVLDGLTSVIMEFRGGEHPYVPKLTADLATMNGI